MAMLKIQQWRPDTHPGYLVEIEWEYDVEAGRDTGREHSGVSIHYPDGTYIHRDTHGADVVHKHFQTLHAEHIIKNKAYSIIAESLPAHMKKPVLDGDGRAVLDDAGRPRSILKESHRPSFNHLGGGRYEFTVPGMDEASRQEIAAKLTQFGEHVVLLKSA